MDLFTEPQWRAIAAIECLSLSRKDYDGFHQWCNRKRILGGVFDAGEFYLGWRDDESEFRVIERPSGLDVSITEFKAEALSEARELLTLAGTYLPKLLQIWTQHNAEQVAAWDKTRAERIVYAAIRKAKEEAKANRTLKVGKRRRAIFEASGGTCHYCGCTFDIYGNWHVDHKMPKALGGSNEPINLVAACAPCNWEKKDKTDLEYLALRAARGDTVKS